MLRSAHQWFSYTSATLFISALFINRQPVNRDISPLEIYLLVKLYRCFAIWAYACARKYKFSKSGFWKFTKKPSWIARTIPEGWFNTRYTAIRENGTTLHLQHYEATKNGHVYYKNNVTLIAAQLIFSSSDAKLMY